MVEAPGFTVNPNMADCTFIRVARKRHVCCGGHDGDRRTACDKLIYPGDVYVEYCGESEPFHSGHRYHLECAAQQGILKQHPAAPASAAGV